MTDVTSPQRSLAPVAADGSKHPARRSYEVSPWYSWAMVAAFEVAMAATLAPLIQAERWGAMTLTLVVMATVVSPTAARPWTPLRLPVPLEMGLVAFVFASLFLGEVCDFYGRYHWWDMILHASSGVLLSLVGLLLAYSLERQHGQTELAPRVAFLFAPMFAMSLGAFWEILEFALQNISGLPIQVPRMSNWAGLSDTMWDVILNASAAIGIAAFGWHHFRPGTHKAAPAWIVRFMAENPRFLVGKQ